MPPELRKQGTDIQQAQVPDSSTQVNIGRFSSLLQNASQAPSCAWSSVDLVLLTLCPCPGHPTDKADGSRHHNLVLLGQDHLKMPC